MTCYLGNVVLLGECCRTVSTTLGSQDTQSTEYKSFIQPGNAFGPLYD